MLVRLIAVGKVRESYVAQACADFRRRLRTYLPLEEIEIKAEDDASILRHVEPSDVLWLLDIAGTQSSSEELAADIERLKTDGTRRLVLVIGGAFGVGDALRKRANRLWSLSRLTFLHEWARAIVLEQLYRASKIARNEPYHH